ncbi:MULTISPECIES: hypothetical protein [unclassified Pseudomonas]|jgi:hypothetical protein|uniref:hypothetical protein n=1 Tax=Pseudomonas sp. A-R-26 TaxID=2832404 RepID=UPI001CBB5314|nr:hypothetical protein [Pseudomonas sp. A-R-26]
MKAIVRVDMKGSVLNLLLTKLIYEALHIYFKKLSSVKRSVRIANLKTLQIFVTHGHEKT